MKISLDGVQETLLIPLVARANETKRKSGKIIDMNAVDLVSKIDYDFAKFDTSMNRVGVIARTVILDREIQKQIDQYPNALCISIGCGLDTRYERLRHGKIQWVNLDFPEVIELRKKLLFEGKNVSYIAKSALDTSWLDDIPNKAEHVIIILEGILMYFNQEEVVQLLCMLHNNFKKCTIFAEIMHPLIAKHTKQHDTVKKTHAVFQWGVKTGVEMEKLCKGLHCINEWNLSDEITEPALRYKVMKSLPFIRNKNNKIVKLELTNPCYKKST